MINEEAEKHLDVYEDRYELHQEGETIVYLQGVQTDESQRRYLRIISELSKGFLEEKFHAVSSVDFTKLTDTNQNLLRNIVNGVTSEVGRALVGLAFLQLTIKSIAPNQSIRLHKGTSRKGSFSWKEGISMRTIDSKYNTPFLRKYGLLKINKYGLFMTRTLAENYPYTSLYKAEMKGPFNDWIAVVDAVENNSMPAELGLCYMMTLLKNRSEKFKELADSACKLVENHMDDSFCHIIDLLTYFFNTTSYSARAFEVIIHCLFQALSEMKLLNDVELVPLSQMRSANKKHGNIGDVELMENGTIFESWDAKYGKPYLRDELEELRDKLITHSDCRVAGFIVDSIVDMRTDIVNRKKELEDETGTEIYLFSFNEWVDYEVSKLEEQQKKTLGYLWLKAVVESFAQKRYSIAPIDEPCDDWLNDFIAIL